MSEKICVLGLGYIGLPTAALLAVNGYSVVGVDVDKEKVNALQKGEIIIDEPGLKEPLKEAIKYGKFVAKSEIEEADVFIIAVPTPLIKESKKAELKYVKSASEMIKSVIKKGNLVVLESTVPPNTCKNLIRPILEQSGLKAGNDFLIAHCPERAMPGTTMDELKNNDRVIGAINDEAYNKTKKLYSSFCKGNMYKTDLTTAECCKLMENTFRDISIAIANEYARIAETLGINVWEVIELANKHPRANILSPGPGVGGHCIAVDPWFLIGNTSAANLTKVAREINEAMPKFVFNKIEKQVENVKDATISILGVAYKADVDDVRESPAIEIIDLCKKQGFDVKVNDPYVKKIEYQLVNLEECLKNSDCAVIITNHKHYYKLTPENFKGMKNKIIIDTRNCIDRKKFENSDVKVITLGDSKNIV